VLFHNELAKATFETFSVGSTVVVPLAFTHQVITSNFYITSSAVVNDTVSAKSLVSNGLFDSDE